MDKKLTEKQLNEVHGGMLLSDGNENVYLVDESNYGILFQCTLSELAIANIPLIYRLYGLSTISELSDIDHAFNNPVTLDLRRNSGSNLRYGGRLNRGRYFKVVRGADGMPSVLNGPDSTVIVP